MKIVGYLVNFLVICTLAVAMEEAQELEQPSKDDFAPSLRGGGGAVNEEGANDNEQRLPQNRLSVLVCPGRNPGTGYKSLNLCSPGIYDGKTWTCPGYETLRAGVGNHCPSGWERCERLCNRGVYDNHFWVCSGSNIARAGVDGCGGRWTLCEPLCHGDIPTAY